MIAHLPSISFVKKNKMNYGQKTKKEPKRLRIVCTMIRMRMGFKRPRFDYTMQTAAVIMRCIGLNWRWNKSWIWAFYICTPYWFCSWWSPLVYLGQKDYIRTVAVGVAHIVYCLKKDKQQAGKCHRELGFRRVLGLVWLDFRVSFRDWSLGPERNAVCSSSLEKASPFPWLVCTLKFPKAIAQTVFFWTHSLFVSRAQRFSQPPRQTAREFGE
jgi:hypothetical protein